MDPRRARNTFGHQVTGWHRPREQHAFSLPLYSSAADPPASWYPSHPQPLTPSRGKPPPSRHLPPPCRLLLPLFPFPRPLVRAALGLAAPARARARRRRVTGRQGGHRGGQLVKRRALGRLPLPSLRHRDHLEDGAEARGPPQAEHLRLEPVGRGWGARVGLGCMVHAAGVWFWFNWRCWVCGRAGSSGWTAPPRIQWLTCSSAGR